MRLKQSGAEGVAADWPSVTVRTPFTSRRQRVTRSVHSQIRQEVREEEEVTDRRERREAADWNEPAATALSDAFNEHRLQSALLFDSLC